MKELWLFSRQYPTGRGEVFLSTALEVWRSCFSSIRIFPMYAGEGRVEPPEGVSVEHLWTEEEAYQPISLTASLGRFPEIMALARRRGDGRFTNPGSIGQAQNHARQLLRKADAVQRQLMSRYDPERVVMLSVWMEDWVNVLGLVKQRVPGMHFATLAHGWDLFEQRRAEGVIPYRAAQLEWADMVCCIARHGKAYLEARHPQHAARLFHTPLGTPDRGVAPWAPDPVLRVVSSAYLRPPKRVQDIAAALRLVKRPMHWTHFGDGEGRAELERAIKDLPGHVTVQLMGHVEHGELMRFYREQAVDLFLHLSAQEGVPVSMMEAASFGIPLVANDVGGVGEVLSPDTGTLLPADTSADALAVWLDSEAPARWCDPKARAQVREAWRQGFEAGANFSRLAGLLSEHQR